jgi:hypothetical protein
MPDHCLHAVVGVLFQQALAFKAATYTPADRLNQILQLAVVRCSDALKAGGLLWRNK